MSALLVAVQVGTSIIITVDVFDHKLEQVVQLGATHTINDREQNVLPYIMEITNGHGVDYASESAGRRESM